MVDFPILKMVTFGLLPSFIKIWYYRLRGAQIGENVSIGLFSILDCNDIVLKTGSKIGFLTYIRTEKFVLGRFSHINSLVYIDTRYVEIGEETIIMEQTMIGGMQTHVSKFIIGDRCKIFPNCVLNTTYPISIGNEVGVGGANYLFTHGSWQSVLDGFPIQFGPITIEDRVWLPWRVFIMPNVRLGEECTIGAGALITKNIPRRSLAVGIPAKVIKNNDEYIKELYHEDKIKVIKNIFFDMMNYLEMSNWEFTIDIDNDESLHMYIDIKDKKLRQSIYVNFIENNDINCNEPMYYISLKSINENTRNDILKHGGSYYDLNSHEWNGKRSYESLEIRNFLGRYGLRFKYGG